MGILRRFAGFAFGLSLLVSAVSAAPLGWTRISSKVNVDIIHNNFHVEQHWLVTGTTRARLLAAVPHLTLSGRYGMYGDRQLLKTDVPVEMQNNGNGVSAWAHPIMVPAFLGSRAATEPTPTGLRASMSGGYLGRGGSEVVFTARSDGSVELVETGTYTLAHLQTDHAIADIPFNLGSATFGRVPLIAAHKLMGELHNKMFGPAEALVHWIEDHK